MEPTLEKYIKLTGWLLVSALALLLVLILFFMGFRAVFHVMEYMPWLTYVYKIFIMLMPSVLFLSAYSVFFIRSARHYQRTVAIFSRIVFVMAMLSWGYASVSDAFVFGKQPAQTVDNYLSYNVWFVSIHVACLFFIGVLQALTTEKEKDWRER